MQWPVKHVIEKAEKHRTSNIMMHDHINFIRHLTEFENSVELQKRMF